MSVNFRVSNRLSPNSSSLRYMDHPPPPSSTSRLSQAINRIELDPNTSKGKKSLIQIR
jgi:hypothetical protein